MADDPTPFPGHGPRGEEKRCVCFKPSGEPDGPRYDCPIHGQDATAEPPATAPRGEEKRLMVSCYRAPGCFPKLPSHDEESCICRCHDDEPPAPAPKHTRHAKGLEPGCPGCAPAPSGEEVVVAAEDLLKECSPTMSPSLGAERRLREAVAAYREHATATIRRKK